MSSISLQSWNSMSRQIYTIFLYTPYSSNYWCRRNQFMHVWHAPYMYVCKPVDWGSLYYCTVRFQSPPKPLFLCIRIQAVPLKNPGQRFGSGLRTQDSAVTRSLLRMSTVVSSPVSLCTVYSVHCTEEAMNERVRELWKIPRRVPRRVPRPWGLDSQLWKSLRLFSCKQMKSYNSFYIGIEIEMEPTEGRTEWRGRKRGRGEKGWSYNRFVL